MLGEEKTAVGKGLKIGFLSEELQATDRHVQFQPGRKTSVWLVTGYGWKRVSGLRSLCRLSTWEWPSSCDCLTWNRSMQPQEPGPRPVLHTPPVDRGKQRLGDLVLVCCLTDGCVTYFQGQWPLLESRGSGRAGCRSRSQQWWGPPPVLDSSRPE